MADETKRPDGEEEYKITVRDRRRVTTEGELREIEDDERPAAPPPPPAEPAEPKPQPAADSDVAAKRSASRKSSGALGGVESARVKSSDRPLREVEVEEDEALADDLDDLGDDGEPQIRSLYDYVQFLASDLSIWSLASLGLMANPVTRLVTTDLDQANFSIDLIEALLDKLVECDKADRNQVMALHHGLVVQYGQVAAQLINQPPQVRLQEMSKIKFCIDTADRFTSLLGEIEDVPPQRLQECQGLVAQLKMAFVQVSGGGGIIQ